MNTNRRTDALLAAGLISFAAVAHAEEGASRLMTALTSTTISGYVDTSAQWNFGTGNANNPPYAFGGSDKADGFNLNVLKLTVEKPLDEAEWAAGYKIDLLAGPDANTFATQSTGQAADFAVKQAYVALRVPVLNGIDLKMGVWDTIIGYEVFESGSNPNYTRSYGYSIEPTTHTGVSASYRLNDQITLAAAVANTFGPRINERAFPTSSDPDNTQAESYKTYMGSIALTAPENWGFLTGSTLYGGVINGFSESYEGNQTSWYVGSTLNTPVTGLKVGAAFDYLDAHNVGGETWAVGGYVSYQATEKLSFHGRAEYLRDRGEQKYFLIPAERVVAVTGTVQYDLWKNVVSRAEFRWDRDASGSESFGGSVPDEPTRSNAFMLAANIIYVF